MRRVKTPRDAKGPGSLKLLERTSASVYNSRMPARSARHMRHSHTLVGARQIVRIDRQPWEERVANILNILEQHRYGRTNALYTALNTANQAIADAKKQKEEVETFAEELQASNEEMRATNEEMKVVTEELERDNMDLEQFVTYAEQELLEVLQTMAVNARSVAAEQSLTGDQKDLLDVIAQNADSLGTLFDSLLTYWRIGMTAAPFEPVHCEDVIEAVMEQHQAMIDKTNTEVTFDPLPMILADREQLTQLFLELIDNAIKFRGKDDLEIHIEAHNISDEKIEIPQSEIQTGWLFSVQDNGMGIESQELEQLFMILQKGNGSTKYAGHGMGLAIAWKAVRRHGGKIWIESVPQEGTTVKFTIPEKIVE